MVTIKNGLPNGVICKTHPDFNSTQGNTVVLVSNETTLFHVPSVVLCTASTQFDVLLKGHSTPCIILSENDYIIERVLRIISGLPVSLWTSIEELEQALLFSERMSFEGAISVIRSGLVSAFVIAKFDPLHVYALAAQRQWEAEAKIASTYTLKLSIFDPVHSKMLHAMSNEALLRLIRFHRRRRDLFKEALDCPLRFGGGNAEQCKACGSAQCHLAWKTFKARMILEMDRIPIGETLSSLDMEDWPEAVACWKAACNSSLCKGRLLYNKTNTLRSIKKCIDELPTSI